MARYASHAVQWKLALAILAFPIAAEGSAVKPYAPHPRPTLPWITTQLIPSPGIAFGDGASHFDVRWQVTPLLLSFAMHRKLSPWRFFVIEPLSRVSGSLEVFVTPEFVDLGPRFEDVFVLRPGMRVTLPVVERGENLSVSFASGAWIHDGRAGGYFEWGAYTLFGVLGIQFTLSPRLKGAEYMFSLRVRYF